MDPLRVGLVIKYFSQSLGGAERHSVILARELLRLGHEVHVFAGDRDEASEELSVVFHPVRARRRSGSRKILSFARAARASLAEVDLDVVHGLTQIWPQDVHRAGGGVHRWWFRQKYGSGPARLFARWTPKEIAQHRVEAEIYRKGNFQLVTTNSELVRGHILSEYDVPPERVEVVRNGVDGTTFGTQVRMRYRDEVRAELALDPVDVPLVVFASNNFGRKGLGVLLEALALRADLPIHLVVAGNGRVRRFQNRAQRLGILNRVHFLGRVDRLERIYGAADALALPTLHDPFANVCLEAMACGLPVVTTRTNGAAEILAPGENGFILENPRDASELSTALDRVLSDLEEARQMGERAAEVARAFTPEANAVRNVEVYRRAIELRS